MENDILYDLTPWEDAPSTATPINAENLNKQQTKIKEIIDKLHELDEAKLGKEEVPNVPVKSVNGKTGAVSLGKTDIGLGNVDNVKQYSASNPPPYPVTSVNGKTGVVTVSVPTKTSQLTNDSNFVTKDVTDQLSGQKADKTNVALYITPEMYGAKGDGSTDDSSAIQQAIDNAGSGNIVYLGKKTYKISTGIGITHSSRTFVCEGTLLYSGNGIAVTIGSHTIKADIDCIDAVNGTAVKVVGTNKYIEKCKINVNRITNSVIGLHLYTDTTSITYNQFRIGHVNSSDIGILVEAKESYINENWYWLGKITGCNVGIKLHSDESLYPISGFGTNDNHFFSGGFEGIASDGIAIYLDNTCGNKFDNLRLQEFYGAIAIKFNGYCRNNDIKLSRISVKEIDITGLKENSHSNVIQSTGIADINNGFTIGQKAVINYEHGIVYDSRCANVSYDVGANTFANNIIKQLDTLIPSTLYFKDATTNSKEFTLDGLYSDYTSMARGVPIVFVFSENMGKILLKDNRGDSILDNRNNEYSGKTVSVKWNGYDKDNAVNIWSVQVLGEKAVTESYLVSKNYATESFVSSKIAEAELGGEEVDLSGYALKSEIPNKTSQLTNDSGFLTQHQDISGKADKSDAETWTFTLADGSTVTKKVVLA